jgi:hypothetical protein
MVFASIAIAIALSSPLVRRLFRPLIEPKPDWLFAKRDLPDDRKHDRKRRRRGERPAPQGESRVDPTGSRRD